MKFKYLLKEESCPNDYRQVLSYMIFNYRILQAYNLHLKGVFTFQCTSSSGNMHSTGRKGCW